MSDREFRIDRAEDTPEDEYTEFSDYELPAHVGSTSFQKVPLVTDEELAASGAEVAIVGAPIDDGASSRAGARKMREVRKH